MIFQESQELPTNSRRFPGIPGVIDTLNVGYPGQMFRSVDLSRISRLCRHPDAHLKTQNRNQRENVENSSRHTTIQRASCSIHRQTRIHQHLQIIFNSCDSCHRDAPVRDPTDWTLRSTALIIFIADITCAFLGGV